jgi:hypothetical protein
MLTQSELKARLHYDPRTGLFLRLLCSGRRKPAGNVNGDGYVHIRVGGKTHKAHRLAWLYMTGEWPDDMIDHKNGARADNKFDNLRQADRAINSQNLRAARRDNTLGVLGVSRYGRRFIARIMRDGRQDYIGAFATAEEAHAAYVLAKRAVHPGNRL